MQDTRLEWLAEKEPGTCSLDEVRRMAREILRLRSALRELKEHASALLSDLPAMIETFRSLAEEGCYCCEVWPVEDEGPCERCLALTQASDVIGQLASMIEHTADGINNEIVHSRCECGVTDVVCAECGASR